MVRVCVANKLIDSNLNEMDVGLKMNCQLFTDWLRTVEVVKRVS
jgi:hypothetical protein